MTQALVTRNQTLAIPMPTGNLEQYIQAAFKIPVLSAAEERSLALRLQSEGDLDAARELVMSHLRFVVRIARGYSGYGLALGDLVQEGNIGLMKAVKRFDPDAGVRLVSYAVHWVRAEIHEFAAQLAHCQSRHHQGATQAVLQPARQETTSRLAEPRRGQHRCGRPWRKARGCYGNGITSQRTGYRL